ANILTNSDMIIGLTDRKIEYYMFDRAGLSIDMGIRGWIK
ncbi:unnamed protein product, partial [marine sediment metagenome]